MSHPGDFFHHPYHPYTIQTDLMNAIYDTIQHHKVGLFESPTGTGKTLSIICSSMTWLRNDKINGGQQSLVEMDSGNLETTESESDDDPDWVKLEYEKSQSKHTQSQAEAYEKYLGVLEQREQKRLQDVANIDRPTRKKRQTPHIVSRDGDTDIVFVPEDYHSDNDDTITATHTKNAVLQSEIQQLLEKLDGSTTTPQELVPPQYRHHVLYTTRTHSQLSQFGSQLRLTSFPSSISEEIAERTKYLSLGSRKQLCIHPKVSKYNSLAAINDGCADMQKRKNNTTDTTTTTCEFLPSNSPANVVKKFVDLNFTSIHDIEDLGKLGTSLKVCPYYSSRAGTEIAEIITLPYQLLLQQSSRDAVKVSIADAVVIIDEAHNLLDTISSINSVTINGRELNQCIGALKIYIEKFKKKLNTGNRVHLLKLSKVLKVLKDYIDKNNECVAGKEVSVHEMFMGTTGDLVNIHKLEKYLAKSKIAYKIESYMESRAEEGSYKHSSEPLLFKIASFLRCLSYPSKEGRFFWDRKSDKKEEISLNYMLLDPSELFREIVESARCVLLCGGTMEPMDDYTNYLFPYLEPSQIKRFSCGHVIPKENLQVFNVGRGVSNKSLEFSFEKRNDPEIINELGLSILRLCHAIPNGIVVFFPSYKYLEQIVINWKKSRLFDRMAAIKPIFAEDPQTESEQLLAKYSEAIAVDNSGLLLSVVGGKLSEGINFSDELARAVIMVGLPYPNLMAGDLVAKRAYVEAKALERGATSQQAKEESRVYYENICMRAINQSVGRAIRHVNDYSLIFLVDSRYENERIQKKLSGWVREGVYGKNNVSFNEILVKTREFFSVKR